MSLGAVVDNDILIKGACYKLLTEFGYAFGGVGVLGAARYVVANTLARHPGVRDSASAVAHWEAFLTTVRELEPTEEEVELATSIEEAAITASVELDGGESQLCAIAIVRSIPRVLTGDKRAIRGMEAILPLVPALVALAGRVACLEQLIATVADRNGHAATKAFVCSEPGVDRAVSICLQCSGPHDSASFDQAGLVSYIEDLRSLAPTVLIAGPPFP